MAGTSAAAAMRVRVPTSNLFQCFFSHLRKNTAATSGSEVRNWSGTANFARGSETSSTVAPRALSTASAAPSMRSTSGCNVWPTALAHEPELHALQIRREVPSVLRDGPGARERILGVVAGDGLKHQGVVRNGASQRAYGVLGPGVHDAAVTAHPAERRAHADHAVRPGGAANGAPGIFADRDRDQPGCD